MNTVQQVQATLFVQMGGSPNITRMESKKTSFIYFSPNRLSDEMVDEMNRVPGVKAKVRKDGALKITVK